MAERKVKWERAPIVTITTTDRIEVRQYWYDRVNDRLRYDVVKVREVKPRKSATTCGQCGKAYSVRACGPTHAMMAVKPRKSGKGKVKRGR